MSNKTLKKLKQELQRLSRKREQLLQTFFSKDKLILGSYMETRIRCGTAGCHCHKDGGHPTMRISRWVDGKLKSKIVRVDDREWVAQAAAYYKAHKQAMSEISKINEQEKILLKSIVELKAQIYQ